MSLENFQKRVTELKRLLDPERIEREKERERKKSLARGLALGSLLGSLAGIFFAPDKGENTRQKTKDELDKIKENLEFNIVEGKQKLEVNLVEGKEKLTEVYKQKKEVVSEKLSSLKEKTSCQPNIVEDDKLELEDEGVSQEEA